MGDGKLRWEIENGKLKFFEITCLQCGIIFFSAAIIDIHDFFFETFCAKKKE